MWNDPTIHHADWGNLSATQRTWQRGVVSGDWLSALDENFLLLEDGGYLLLGWIAPTWFLKEIGGYLLLETGDKFLSEVHVNGQPTDDKFIIHGYELDNQQWLLLQAAQAYWS